MASSTLLSSGLSGGLFGAALAASGVFTPAVVMAQMRLEDFHMMKVFLTASAGSALVVNLFSQLGLVHVAPRPGSSLGLFSAYDGNILGGLSIGFGMALAGACPGTVFVQVGARIPSGLVCLAGGVSGGIVYGSGIIDGILAPLKSGNATTGPGKLQEAVSKQPSELTVYGKLNMSPNSVLLSFEIVCAAAISLVTFAFDHDRSVSLKAPSGALHPLIGGSLVASAQAASLLLTGGALGASAFYADVARYLIKATGSATGKNLKPSPKSLVFTAGIMAAGWAVTYCIPEIAFAAAKGRAGVSTARSFLGGFFLAFGARMAGGCTSGHGISGMSSMSVASFISVAAMFAGGMGLAVFI